MIQNSLNDTYKPITRIDEQTYSVSWGLTHDTNENYNYWKTINVPTLYKNCKPSVEFFKKAIINSIDSDVKRNIENNLVWKGMKIKLSQHKQIDYAATYNIVINSDKILPLTYKFENNNAPIYYTFESVEDYTDFYTAIVKHINKCLINGWNEQEAINWNDYKL